MTILFILGLILMFVGSLMFVVGGFIEESTPKIVGWVIGVMGAILVSIAEQATFGAFLFLIFGGMFSMITIVVFVLVLVLGLISIIKGEI